MAVAQTADEERLRGPDRLAQHALDLPWDHLGVGVRTCPIDRTDDHFVGRVIAPHRVDGNANRSVDDGFTCAQDVKIHGSVGY